MNSSDNVILRLNGTDYVGWEEATVTRALDQASSSFSLLVSDPAEGSLPVGPGNLVQILYGADLLVTGYVDSVSVEYGPDNHSIRIDGRSRTKDLVDCSALDNSRFVNQTILQIATKLAEPYGIKVRVGESTDLKPIPNFQVETDGETVFQALQRLAETQELTISDTPEGDLLLTRIGSTTSANSLIKTRKDNTGIKSCSFQVGEHTRYSEVIVKGQKRADDKQFGKQVSQIIASAIDSEIKRKRVKIIRADVETTTEDATKKAQWEITGAAGKGLELTYIVQDWRGNQNALWRENQLVNVTDNKCGIASTVLVITKVEYSINNSGTVATLTLNPPEMFKEQFSNSLGKSKINKKSGKNVTEKIIYWEPPKE